MNRATLRHNQSMASKLAIHILVGSPNDLEFHARMEKYGRLVFAHRWTIGVSLGIMFSRTLSQKLIHTTANYICQQHMSPTTAIMFIKIQTDAWMKNERAMNETNNPSRRAAIKLSLKNVL